MNFGFTILEVKKISPLIDFLFSEFPIPKTPFIYLTLPISKSSKIV